MSKKIYDQRRKKALSLLNKEINSVGDLFTFLSPSAIAMSLANHIMQIVDGCSSEQALALVPAFIEKLKCDNVVRLSQAYKPEYSNGLSLPEKTQAKPARQRKPKAEKRLKSADVVTDTQTVTLPLQADDTAPIVSDIPATATVLGKALKQAQAKPTKAKAPK
jgi:hypothetical protein